MVDETLFDYLHMSIVDFYNEENDKDIETSSAYLSQIGSHFLLSRRVQKCRFDFIH